MKLREQERQFIVPDTINLKLSSREIEYIDSLDQEKSDIFMKLYDCGSF